MKFDIQKGIDILTNKIESWLELTVSMLPNIVIAIVVLLIFIFIAKAVKSLADKVLNKFSDKSSINNLISTAVYLFILGAGLIITLNILHLDQTVTSLLAGAGIIGLALGFAFQDLTANFISGVFIAIKKPIQVGDIIETGSYMGIVEEIDLRVTVLKTFQGLHVIIPNKDVFQSPVTNYTRTNERRVDLDVGISYGDDLDKVKSITLNAIKDLPFIIEGREVDLYFKEFGDSSINFTVMLWIRYAHQAAFLQAQSDAIVAIKKAFDKNEITIPFPIRTLDFGIKGGEKLKNHLTVSSKNSD